MRIMKDSGIEWVKDIPSTWDVAYLSAVLSERKNKNIGMKENNLLSLSYGNVIRKDITTNDGLLPESFEGYNIIEKDDIKRNLYSEGKLKKENESIYLTIEAVNEAINQKKKISFQYFQYDVRKKRHLKNNGIPYKFSPYSLVWNGDYYYMVGYCDKHKNIGSYRIDRVYKRPIILEEKIVPMPDDFDISEFSDSMFHMYNSERKTVQLICANETMDAILDKFGMDVATYAYDMKSFKVEVNVAVSHVFYSWVFGFDGRVKILTPDDVKQEYKEMILKSAKKLEKDSD